MTGAAEKGQCQDRCIDYYPSPGNCEQCACTQDWQMEGRSASSEQIEVLLKEVYVMMCGSSNNADANSKDDKKKDTSLESFMTLDEFLK